MAARDLPVLTRGTVLKQTYSISGRIGSGGQGRLYLATCYDGEAKRLVVIKAAAAESLRSEYDLLLRFDHPGIPRAYDFFVEDGWCYMALECIPGLGSLQERQRVFRDGCLPVEEVLTIGTELCEILTYLHTRCPPVVHCDIKPGNIVRARTGRVMLIDFGVACYLQPSPVRRRTSRIKGTPGYMAPEYQQAGVATPQTDLYSLGATLYTLLKGRSPLENGDEFGLFRAGWGRLGLLLRSLLAPDPQWRPQSAEAVRQALLDIQNARDQQGRWRAWLTELSLRLRW
jgi:serine/threonine protein kinase